MSEGICTGQTPKGPVAQCEPGVKSTCSQRDSCEGLLTGQPGAETGLRSKAHQLLQEIHLGKQRSCLGLVPDTFLGEVA